MSAGDDEFIADGVSEVGMKALWEARWNMGFVLRVEPFGQGGEDEKIRGIVKLGG
jgi:hypothetical protein